MKLIAQHEIQEYVSRSLQCDCGHKQLDRSTRLIADIACDRCGRVEALHTHVNDKNVVDTRSAEFDFIKYNGVDAPKDYR